MRSKAMAVVFAAWTLAVFLGAGSVSRGQKQPYIEHAAWTAVEQVTLDREAEESAGTFGARIRELEADCVIDLTCYTLASAQQLSHGYRRLFHCLGFMAFAPMHHQVFSI